MQESYNVFVCIWKGVLHHITNTHEWYLGHDGGVNRCLHEPLSTEDIGKPWLDPSDLTAVVLDKRMLGKVGSDISGIRLHRVWNKKSGRWTVYVEKERKSYKYVDEVVEMALTRRISDKVGMRKRMMEAGDPRQISKHLAPVEPPPTKDIHAAIVSRFK